MSFQFQFQPPHHHNGSPHLFFATIACVLAYLPAQHSRVCFMSTGLHVSKLRHLCVPTHRRRELRSMSHCTVTPPTLTLIFILGFIFFFCSPMLVWYTVMHAACTMARYKRPPVSSMPGLHCLRVFQSKQCEFQS